MYHGRVRNRGGTDVRDKLVRYAAMHSRPPQRLKAQVLSIRETLPLEQSEALLQRLEDVRR